MTKRKILLLVATALAVAGLVLAPAAQAGWWKQGETSASAVNEDQKTTSSPSAAPSLTASTAPSPAAPAASAPPAAAPAKAPAAAPAPRPAAPAPAAAAPLAAAPVAATTTAGRPYPLHTNIVSTTFWVGELFNASLADGSQVCSAYDSNWAFHWSGINKGTVPSSASGCAGSIIGGCDGVAGPNNSCTTEPRTAANGYFPTKVPTPKQNPFYLDLPYDDLNDPVAFQERCSVIPWANDPGYAGHCADPSFSYMKDRWVKMTGPNGHTCYGQIADAGPSHDNLYHDKAYVFGANNAQPVQGQFNNAGADVSPALNGCLGFAELNGQTDRISWQFVDAAPVPAGPWKTVVTTSGVSN